MADEQRVSTVTVVVAFLAGAALGAIAALLLAPQSGEETRRRLRSAAKEASERVRQVAERAEGAWKVVAEEGQALLKETKPLVAEALEAGRKALDRLRGCTSEPQPTTTE
jgi:gas vesicle protein